MLPLCACVCVCVCAHACVIVFALMSVMERERGKIKASSEHQIRGFHCHGWGDNRKSKKLSRSACLSFPLNHSAAGGVLSKNTYLSRRASTLAEM